MVAERDPPGLRSTDGAQASKRWRYRRPQWPSLTLGHLRQVPILARGLHRQTYEMRGYRCRQID